MDEDDDLKSDDDSDLNNESGVDSENILTTT